MQDRDENLTFTPRQLGVGLRRIFGIFFALIGGSFACVLAVTGSAFALLFWSSAEFSLLLKLLSLIFPLIGIAIGAGSVLIGLAVALLGTKQTVQITADSLQHNRGKQTVAIRLDEMERIRVQRRRGTKARYYWTLIVEDAADRQIKLGMPYGGNLALFDTRAILRALLPRLPANVEIDERIHGYVDTGWLR